MGGFTQAAFAQPSGADIAAQAQAQAAAAQAQLQAEIDAFIANKKKEILGPQGTGLNGALVAERQAQNLGTQFRYPFDFNGLALAPDNQLANVTTTF